MRLAGKLPGVRRSWAGGLAGSPVFILPTTSVIRPAGPVIISPLPMKPGGLYRFAPLPAVSLSVYPSVCPSEKIWILRELERYWRQLHETCYVGRGQ